MRVTVAEVLRGVRDTLDGALAGVRAQTMDELQEGVVDLPTVQVYHESGGADPSGSTHQTTMRGGVIQEDLVVHVDIYVRQRAHIGEDMLKVVEMVDVVRDVMMAQKVKPYFSIEGVKAFKWRHERVTFEYGGAAYAGTQFVLDFRIF